MLHLVKYENVTIVIILRIVAHTFKYGNKIFFFFILFLVFVVITQ